MDMIWVYIWIGVIVLTVVTEAATMGLTSIWFTFGALVAWIIAMCSGPLWLQWLCFVVVSGLMLAFTRPLAVKYLKPKKVATNVDALTGREGKVVTEIQPIQGTGQVKVDGQIWSAKLENTDVNLPVGSLVEVLRVEGVKLVVRAKTAAE